nr:putative reverse transcriptase domain-containing protein [Tanacetum cinerariifolium]
MSISHQKLASLEANGFCKELAIPKQTALGKAKSNPFMAGSLPKTKCYKLMLFGLTKDDVVNLMLLELVRMVYEKSPPKLTFYKAFFSTQWKLLIHTLVQRVSAKRTTCKEFSCSMASAIICLTTGRKFNFSMYIFDNMTYPLTTTSIHPLTQKVFDNIRKLGKGFSGLETPLFASMPVQPQAEVEEDDVEVPATPTPPSSTITPTPPPQDPITTPPQAQPAPPSSPPQEQQTNTSESYIIGNTQAQEEGQKVREEEEIKVFWFKEGRKDEDNVVIKDVSATEPTVFDDEVTMTMALTLIKMKAKKARLLDEQIAKRLYDEEVEQAAAREKQEKDYLERAKVLQQQYDDKQENIDWNVIVEEMQEKHLNNIRKYQKKDYPLSNGVMTLMLSTRLQVKEDSEMARDLVMKIFMKTNQPKSRKLIQETIKKLVQIKQGMQAARDRQKSYADLKRRPMEFQVGDKVMLKKSYADLKRKPMEFQVEDNVMLKVSPWKKGRTVHNTLHVSNLKKCHADEPLAAPLDGLHLDDKFHFVEKPVEIMDREVKRLKRS